MVDAAGNQDIDDYLVEAIANVKPNATVPPDAAADWGIPVQFHASAVDPGPADQPTLAFAWNFGDGQGAAGPDVSHTFAAPDDYDVEVTVTDKDGGVGAAAMTTSISKRDTDLVYTGPTQSLPNKQINLSATLSDEHGQPVVGRTVSFALGTQSASGVTNSAGVVSVSLRLTQKNGTYQVSMSFAGDTLYNSDSTAPINFRIGK